MINYLKGKITLKEKDFIILEVNQIGFQVFLSDKTLNKIPKIGEFLKVFTYLYLREETVKLYGFLTIEELKLFKILNDISGVGPKAAATISSIGTFDELKKAIKEGDQKFFEGVRGIGRKKIQKIILELTGKIEEIKKPSIQEDPALQALVSLGFPLQKAKEALSRVPENIKETGERIKEALRIINR
jgi:Holliday junction DNA helicase RuvA